MTPGARIAAAIEIWSEIDKGQAPVDSIIGGYFRARRYAGSKDRRFVTTFIHDALRRAARLNWWVRQAGLEATPKNRVLANLILSEQNGPEQIQKLYSGSRHCPDTLTDDEQKFAQDIFNRELDHPDMPEWVRNEYPEWLDQAFQSIWPDTYIEELQALNQPALLNLRVNSLKGDRDEALQSLRQDGIEADPCNLSPVGITVKGNPRLNQLSIFKKGVIEIQDEGSQIIAKMTDARPGMKIVDFCAGAGGKTLALAADMGVNGRAKGWITACDISARRLKKMDERMRRAGARNIRTHTLGSEQDPWVRDNEKRTDRLLLDVPCSGTGTWRRNVDARWQLKPDGLADLMARQGRILDNAHHLVKPGGRLVYATCSLLREENEYQVERFLDNHADYRLVPAKDVWQETIGDAYPAGTDDHYLRLTPRRHGTDGFFTAVLERQS